MRISDWSSDVCSSDLSKDRLANLEEELANLEQESSELTQRWQAEKEKINSEAKLKEQLDAARIELEQAQRNGDLARAGELSYGAIPQLTKQLEEAQAVSQGAMLREEVTNEDRSEERSVGKECDSTCSTRWAPSH